MNEPNSSDWEDPDPVDTIDAMALPPSEGRVPAALWSMVDAVGEAYQVPRDLPFLLVLSILSTGIGGRRKVRVTPDWTEVLSLYTATALPPGDRKSPTLAEVAAPLYRVERQLAEAAHLDIQQQRSKRDLHAAHVEKLKKGGDTSSDGIAGLEAAVKQLEEIPVREIPRMIVDDVTPEALARRMDEQGGRIGALSAEGGIFGTLAGRYSNGVANLDLVLKAWSGDPVRVDRAGRETLIIDEPVLSIGLAVQPAILQGLTDSNRVLLESGFLARFLYAVPASLVGSRKSQPDAIPHEAKAGYTAAIESLARLWTQEKTTELELETEATAKLHAFRDAFEKRLHPLNGDLAELSGTGWASKLPGQLVRVAGLFTLFDNAEATSISAEMMNEALGLADYFIDHAQHAFGLMAGRYGTIQRPHIVMAWLRRKKPEEFSVRDARRALGGQEWAQDVEAIRDVLAELEELGWIRLKEQPEKAGPGRKPSERYQTHPNLRRVA